jgi:outer membrane protein, heavy metal efflux system
MSVRLLILTLLAGIASSACQAQGDSDKAPPAELRSVASNTANDASSSGVTRLTIGQALALGEQDSPILKEAAASVSHAQAGIQSARAYTNPTFEFLGGHQSARPIATPGVPGATLHYSAGQTIEMPSERRSRIQVSRLDLRVNEYQLASVRLAVIADVKRAFYNVLRRKQELVQTQDNLSLVEDLRRRVQMQVQVGEKGKLELTRAEAELSRARAAVRSADIELANARALLKAAIGSSSSDTFDAEGSLGDTAQMQPLDEIRQRVLANHPALAQANAQRERAEAAVQHEHAKRIPEPTAFGEYERQPDITFYRFGVNIPIPLWDRRKGPIAEAKAEVDVSESVARQRRLEIMAALERAYDQYEISNEQVVSLQGGSLREAEAAVDAARAAYKFGERGIVEVLDAQRVLQGVRGDLLDALFARQSALIDLEELGATRQ